MTRRSTTFEGDGNLSVPRNGGGSIDLSAVGEERTLLEEFVSVVAHEVVTPLTVVKGAVATLLRMGDEGDHALRRELLEMIDRHANLAGLLIDRMGLARDVERGTVRLHRTPTDLGDLVERSVADLRQAVLGEHPVEVAVLGGIAVEADRTALQEIVFNLLLNAAKYSADDAVIDLTVDRHRSRARLVVRDRGQGVQEEDRERIFRKFVQGDRGSAGVGLGLFIARGLARAHGGDLSVRTAAGGGSEFVLELPLPS